MAHRNRIAILTAAFASILSTMSVTANAGDFTGPGVKRDEIIIGNTAPYSGPVSALGATIKAAAAYFQKVNDEGGVTGRKIKFISYDDAYAPPKAFEQTRRLIESDDVLLVFGSLGTPTNAAVQKYLNDKNIPQLFVMSGAARFHDPVGTPWSMGWPLSLRDEGFMPGKYFKEAAPDAKIAVLYQNDDFGRDLLNGLVEALGPSSKAIVAKAPYDVGSPTVDSQILQLKASGADHVMSFTTPKYTAQAIRRVAETGWKAKVFIPQSSASVGGVLKPAGIENSQGVVSWASYKDPTDASWHEDAGMKDWLNFMQRYYPDGDRTDISNVVGYLLAKTLVTTLQQAGEDLSRENVMRQATQLKSVSYDMLLPGVTIDTVRTPFTPLSQAQMLRFTGDGWERFGSVLQAEQHH
jgi:ABC-type branched-subunit amino acid transport system substrate-binding protein